MVVYEWPNGSTVEFLQVDQINHSAPAQQRHSQTCLFLYTERSFPTVFGDGRFVSVWIKPHFNFRASVQATSLGHAIRDSGLSGKRIMEAYPLVKKRVISFLWDAGAKMTSSHHLFSSSGSDIVRPHVPFFVPDEEWEDRYERARRHHLGTADHTPDFLGPVGEMQIWMSPDQQSFKVRWIATYSSGGFGSFYIFSSLEGAVDFIVDRFQIWPESRRREWQDSLDRGTFVRPSPEEVEMYRMLDEPLPFFLPDAPEWLRSQQPS